MSTDEFASMNPALGADYWRNRAVQARSFADDMIDIDARTAMENLAVLCDAMAVRSERRQPVLGIIINRSLEHR
jgi:hypothetical protein